MSHGLLTGGFGFKVKKLNIETRCLSYAPPRWNDRAFSPPVGTPFFSDGEGSRRGVVPLAVKHSRMLFRAYPAAMTKEPCDLRFQLVLGQILGVPVSSRPFNGRRDRLARNALLFSVLNVLFKERVLIWGYPNPHDDIDSLDGANLLT
jgi:hypothetical protein